MFARRVAAGGLRRERRSHECRATGRSVCLDPATTADPGVRASSCVVPARIALLRLPRDARPLGAALPAAALALPDGRGYEQVTPLDKNGIGPGQGSDRPTATRSTGRRSAAAAGRPRRRRRCSSPRAPPAAGRPARDARSRRRRLVGLFEEQPPLWWSRDLSKTIYTTPASYTAANHRPPGPGANQLPRPVRAGRHGRDDLAVAGTVPRRGHDRGHGDVRAATADGQHVAFDSPERLTSDATGLADLNTPPQFLYERNVAAGTTSLVNMATTTLSAAAAAGDTQSRSPVRPRSPPTRA